jgi:hypothetical protein
MLYWAIIQTFNTAITHLSGFGLEVQAVTTVIILPNDSKVDTSQSTNHISE